MKQFIPFLLVAVSGLANAQYTVRGVVNDSLTGTPLAFVNILSLNEAYGTSTDIDGKFILNSKQPIKSLRFSYVGYKGKTVPVSNDNINVLLAKKQVSLKEVVVMPGENPAHRIIKKAVENKHLHHPDKMPEYACNSYNKIVYTANSEKVLEDKDKKGNIDSSAIRLADYLENHYLLLLESYTKKIRLAPNFENETVLTSRVSGLSKPSFTILSNDVQPFSFYDDYINLLDKEYLNPISKGSESKYLFVLEDTVFQELDTVYIISFTQRKSRNFDALKGVVYINTSGYAIQNVIAEPYHSSLNKAKVQQKYSQVNGKQWFPVQLNFNWEIKEYGLQVTGKSYISNVDLSPGLTKKDFNLLNIQLADTATQNTEENLTAIRTEPLTQKEQNTYQYLDSVGKARNLDHKMYLIESVATGSVPFSIFSLRLNNLYSFNEFEGHRPGLRLETNDKLLKWLTIGGYGAWGSRDQLWKYGASIDLSLDEKKDIGLSFKYKRDVEEPGNVEFLEKTSTLLNSGAKQLLVSRMVLNDQYFGSFSWRLFRYILFEAGLSTTEQSILSPYRFLAASSENVQVALSQMQLTEASIKLRFAYQERFAEVFGKKVSLGTKFPIVWLNYEKGFSEFLGGFFNYERIAAKATESFRLPGLGKASITVEGGMLSGQAPASRNFFGKASYSDNIFLQVDETFQTMRLYEFLSQRFVNVFVSHNLGKIHFFTEKVKPEFILIHSMGWGSLENANQHAFIETSTMEKGYYESGLLIQNVFRLNYLDVAWLGFGAGAYYRYGPYAFPKPTENLAIKLSVSFSL